MRIIPAIDIIGGKCVRLTQGDYSKKKVYSEDPLEVARRFEDSGLEFLHLVDLDGAKSGKVTNLNILERICRHTELRVDFGGGIKSLEDAKAVLDVGASQFTVGSLAVSQKEVVSEWGTRFGYDRIIIGADVREDHVATQGWTKTSALNWKSYLEFYADQGFSYAICTDIARDGMLMGPSLDLYESMINEFSGIALIASGGIRSLQDLRELKELGCEGAIVGKAIYENLISLKELAALEFGA